VLQSTFNCFAGKKKPFITQRFFISSSKKALHQFFGMLATMWVPRSKSFSGQIWSCTLLIPFWRDVYKVLLSIFQMDIR